MVFLFGLPLVERRELLIVEMFLSCRSWPPDSRFDSWSNVLDELLRKAVVFFLFLWHFDLWDPCLRHGLLRFLDLLSAFFLYIYIFLFMVPGIYFVFSFISPCPDSQQMPNFQVSCW